MWRLKIKNSNFVTLSSLLIIFIPKTVLMLESLYKKNQVLISCRNVVFPRCKVLSVFPRNVCGFTLRKMQNSDTQKLPVNCDLSGKNKEGLGRLPAS